MVFDQPGAARYFAIVPAAGRSRRMGSSKLLLPWPAFDSGNDIADPQVIDSVLHAWTTSRVAHVVVVIRSDDVALLDACEKWRVDVVTAAVEPADMKESLQIGLRYIESRFSPIATDHCFIAPADLPTLSRDLIDAVIESADALGRARPAANATQPPVIIPRFGATPGSAAKTGHPALLPWPLTEEIFRLGENEGVDRLVKQHSQHIVDLPGTLAVTDINTPEEYRRGLDGRSRVQEPQDNVDS